MEKNNRFSSREMQPFEQEHIDVVRKAVPECMVLLKNEGVLPLKSVGEIALYGSGARWTIKGGTGSGDVNVRHFVTVEEGLENAGFTITTKEWLDKYDVALIARKREYYQAMRKEADALGVNPTFHVLGRPAPEPHYAFDLNGSGDTAIYVLARNSGEGADRTAREGDIRLTGEEIRDILELNNRYANFVLVLNVGGMVDLEPVKDVSAILLLSQLGTPTGDALADVLTGKAYPSGKLTMTWAPLDAYPSTVGFGDVDDTSYTEGIYVGYRYFAGNGSRVLYPFGYGLSYTTFAYTDVSAKLQEDTVCVHATVTNTGSFAGKEIVQVYYSAPAGRLDKPVRELAAYTKTRELRPGQQQTVEILFPMKCMASYDEQENCWLLEAGSYHIGVGRNSSDLCSAGMISLDEQSFGKALPVSHTTENPAISSETFFWEDVCSGKCSIAEFASALTNEQLLELCVGEHTDSEDAMEVIGDAAVSVAGAAGETSRILKGLGVPSLVMADGPAGIRLSQEYVLCDDGPKGTSSLQGDVMLIFTDEELAVKNGMNRRDQNSTVYYQYCVAIPIGTAIAQTWNDDLAQKLGELVGREMEIFGIHIWLAPALNIMRSPLCGRNFEYYSEDPLISGKIAAAITRGVQSHPGRAVTIKHFACNNQETNRYFSNSIVSQRALREIYLKGFEIAVREAQPDFIMTSYNLLNGEHTCCRRDLITSILREEWGFLGVVMTDWLVTGGMEQKGTKWAAASAAGNILAGNDITMPGMTMDIQEIRRALSDPNHPYALCRRDLLACAERILRMILKMTGSADGGDR